MTGYDDNFEIIKFRAKMQSLINKLLANVSYYLQKT